jgi:putative membrane protein
MIKYDSKSWGKLPGQLYQTFAASYNQKTLLKGMTIVTIYATVITYVNMQFKNYDYTIDTFFFSLLGIVLGLFLVFRLNSSYDRWWEGRKQWGKLVNDCRTLALNVGSLLDPKDVRHRKSFVMNITNFCLSLKEHLRDNRNLSELIFINKYNYAALEQSEHIPNQIAGFMFNDVEKLFKNGHIVEADKINLKVQLQGLIDVLGACERIKNTPIPFSHSTFIKTFIVVYLLILPFGLVDVFHWLTIPACMVMSYAMIGIEIISEEIENPFGTDANDLPTSHLCTVIGKNVHEILKVQPMEKVKRNPKLVNSSVEILL